MSGTTSDKPRDTTGFGAPGKSASDGLAPRKFATTNDGPAPQIASSTLLQGRDAVMIEHNGRLYQLRQTRQGKLILTK